MRSESTSAFGQPSETNDTLGAAPGSAFGEGAGAWSGAFIKGPKRRGPVPGRGGADASRRELRCRLSIAGSAAKNGRRGSAREVANEGLANCIWRSRVVHSGVSPRSARGDPDGGRERPAPAARGF